MPEVRNRSKVRCDRIPFTPTPADWTTDIAGIRPRAVAGPSGGATESLPAPPWSTSAFETHGSWRAFARSADRSVSQFHFLPHPEPWTRTSRAAGGPVTSTRAIPYIVGANRSDALVGDLVGKTPAHGVPFRPQHKFRPRPGARTGVSCQIERHAAFKYSGSRPLPIQDESRFDKQ